MGAACGGEGPHFAAYPEEWSSAACNTADHGKCPQGSRKAGVAQARRQYGGPTKKEGRALAGTASRRWKRGWTNIHTTRSSPDLSQQSLSTWLSKRRAQVLSATGEQQLVIVRRGWLLRVIPPPCRWCWEKHTSPRFRGYRKAPTASVFRELLGFLHVTVQLKAAACGLASVVVRSAAEKGERNKKTRGQERDFTARALASMEEGCRHFAKPWLHCERKIGRRRFRPILHFFARARYADAAKASDEPTLFTKDKASSKSF